LSTTRVELVRQHVGASETFICDLFFTA